jgi:16S rRNA processing protein RimM
MRRKSRKDSAVRREELVEIGVITKPWGVRGEVKVRLSTDVPGRFAALDGVFLSSKESEPTFHRIEGVKNLRGAVAMKLEAVGSPEEAELLRGLSVSVPESERAPLGEDEYYIYDLVGLDVLDPEGRVTGTLAKVYQGSGQDVFEVATGTGPVLVPAVKAYIVSVDIRNGRIVLRLPVEDVSASPEETESADERGSLE